MVGSDPTTIGDTQNFNTNVVPNVDVGPSFLNARYHTIKKVRMPQIGRASGTFNIVVTGSHNNSDNLAVPGLLETSNSSVFTRFFGSSLKPGTTNLTAEETAKIIFGLGEGVSSAHGAYLTTNNQFVGWENIRGFRYGLSNVKDRKPRVVFRRDRFGQLRDMLEMAPNTAYIDDNTNTIVRAIEAQFFADDGSIASPEATSCSNLSTFVTSSAPFFDREVVNFEDTEVVRNRGPLNNKVADITIEI